MERLPGVKVIPEPEVLLEVLAVVVIVPQEVVSTASQMVIEALAAPLLAVKVMFVPLMPIVTPFGLVFPET